MKNKLLVKFRDQNNILFFIYFNFFANNTERERERALGLYN